MGYIAGYSLHFTHPRLHSKKIFRAYLSHAQKCLVTGGGGFLGRHLVEDLAERGHEVVIFDRVKTFDPPAGITFVVGDLRKKEDVMNALKGCDVCFHCASPSPHANNPKLFYEVNILGTQELLDSCGESGVKKFVLTSSASVVFEGRDNKNGDESMPYATRALDEYTKSKVAQEKLVLAYNNDSTKNKHGVLTCAMRPHGIFGPRDPQFFPAVIETARAGKMKFIIGDGKNLVDVTYVRNVTLAHILAAEALKPKAAVCGKAYFITNNEPVPFWSFTGDILEAFGYPRPWIYVPYMLLLVLSMFVDFFCSVLVRTTGITVRPTFTPSRIALTGTYHYYTTEAARRDFGYVPQYKLKEAFDITIKSYPNLHKDATKKSK